MFPALAVADVLRARGHNVLYAGTREGMEAKLVPEAGYAMAYIRSGALNRVGLRKQLGTAALMPGSVLSATKLLRQFHAQAVFSMGGFVAGPVMAAALCKRVPLIVMEPNACPGFANRQVARWVYRALVGFEATKRFFPADRVEVTGLPVRSSFFSVPRKRDDVFTVLITGGSRGARTLNRAARESWPLFRDSKNAIRLILQTGTAEYDTCAAEFAASGLDGKVVPFLRDMPQAFAEADLVVGRAGAGAVNELAAAGMPALLVPFPFAADDHQRKNAETLVDAGAARMVLDQEFTGERLFNEVEQLRSHPNDLEQMRTAVRAFATPGAAERAADLLEQAAGRKK